MANMKKPGAKTSKSTTRGLGPAQKPVSPKTPIFANRAKSTNVALKKEALMPRATKRGTAVAMPMKPGNIATGAKNTAKPMPTAKATKKPMTASEKAFIKNQKEKAKATKRTGVYPNTAN
jgi:hypothetical protein